MCHKTLTWKISNNFDIRHPVDQTYAQIFCNFFWFWNSWSIRILTFHLSRWRNISQRSYKSRKTANSILVMNKESTKMFDLSWLISKVCHWFPLQCLKNELSCLPFSIFKSQLKTNGVDSLLPINRILTCLKHLTRFLDGLPFPFWPIEIRTKQKGKAA